ncbi:MAG: DNA-binding protein [Bacteroidetes bacterium]|nr:DNA-binding protein [Bacteroidota bacterium]
MIRNLFAFIILFSCIGYPQDIRTIKQNPVKEADKLPNNDSVATAYALPSRFSSVVIVRIKYQADLLRELTNIVGKNGIKNGVILSGIGSVTGYHIHVVNNTSFPTSNEFIKNPNAPSDIVNLNGYIIDGRVHAHITLADGKKAFGGHLEEGTQVFTFAIITIGILENIDLNRVDDSTYR